MDQWEILGTEKTTDVAKIKRAYAARAKQWHPEEYPEEFKRLQGAYRAALAWAKANAAAGEHPREASGMSGWPGSGQTSGPGSRGSGETRGSSEWLGSGQTSGPGSRGSGETCGASGWPGSGTHGSQETSGTARDAGSRGDVAGSRTHTGPAPDFDVVNDAIRAEITRHKQERLTVGAWLAVKNPYLQNNPAYWRYLFSQEEYRELFADRVFMGKLARILSKEKGWYRGTIRLIDQQISPADPGLRWKWLRFRPYDRPPLAEGISSTKLMEIHRMLLGRIREAGYPDDIDRSREALAAYLEQYIPFADQNTQLLEQAGRHIRRVRAGMLGVFAAMLLVIVCVICAGAESSMSENARARAHAAGSAGEEDGASGGDSDRENAEKKESDAGNGPKEAAAGSAWNQERLDELEKELAERKDEGP